MARIRTVKPSIWGDSKFAALSRDARLLTIGLISVSDDAGRFIASPTALAGFIYPHDKVTAAHITKWRDEIAQVGLIELYRVGGGEYGWFPKWRSHQRINRPSRSALPAPPGHGDDPGPDEPVDDGDDSLHDSPPGSLNAHGGTGEPFTPGREGKGKGRESPSPHAERGELCAKHPNGDGPNCRRCGTNTRSVNRAARLAAVGPWCGECEAPDRRLVELADGRVARCPRCNPQVRTA